MLGVAKKLRQEREREKELQAQKSDQRTAIQHIDQRVARMEAKLKDSRQQVDKCRAPGKSMYVLLSRTQAGPGRTVKQEQEEISRNHVQTFIYPSVVIESAAECERNLTTP